MLHAVHYGACGAATYGSFKLGERFLIATGCDFNIAGAGVPDPSGDAELLRPLTHEPPETNPLHSSNNAEVDDRHLRCGLAATSEQRGENGGDDGSICLNRSTGEKQNFAATQTARYELERRCSRQARSVPLCLADVVGQREARFNEVITRERRLVLARRGALETGLVYRDGP